ncbi:MAG: outer membrane protein assembly factor BamB family protein [Thermoleophilia bacterium]
MTAPSWIFSSNGKLLVRPLIHQDTVYIVVDDSCLYAVNIGEAEEKWRYATRGKIVATPAISDGVLYFGNDNSMLYAIDFSTGEKLWQFSAERPIRATPVIEAGLVLVGAEDGNFYGVDASTGIEKWRVETGHKITEAAAVTVELVYFRNHRNTMFAVALDNGRQKHRLDGLKWSTAPVASGEQVIFGKNDKLIAIDAGSDVKVWDFSAGQRIAAPPLVDSAVVCFGAGPYLYGVDAVSGEQRWETVTGSPPRETPAVNGGTAYFVTSDHSFFAVDIADGRILESFDTGRFAVSQPAVTSEWIFLGSEDHNLYGYRNYGHEESIGGNTVADYSSEEAAVALPRRLRPAHILEHPYSNAQVPWQLFLLAFLFPVYMIYWFYRNWTHWNLNRGTSFRAGLMTFGMFLPVVNSCLAYTQFKLIRDTAREEKLDTFVLPVIAAGYIGATLLPDLLYVLGRFNGIDLLGDSTVSLFITLATAVVAVFFIAKIQVTLNLLWKKKFPELLPRNFFTKWEMLMLVLGLASLLLRYLSSLALN